MGLCEVLGNKLRGNVLDRRRIRQDRFSNFIVEPLQEADVANRPEGTGSDRLRRSDRTAADRASALAAVPRIGRRWPRNLQANAVPPNRSWRRGPRRRPRCRRRSSSTFSTQMANMSSTRSAISRRGRHLARREQKLHSPSAPAAASASPSTRSTVHASQMMWGMVDYRDSCAFSLAIAARRVDQWRFPPTGA